MESHEHSAEGCRLHREIPLVIRWMVTLAVVCTAVILLRPLLVRQVITRGDGYLNYGMLEEAIRQYRRAIFIDSRRDRARNWLGYALHKSGKIEEAIRAYQEAIETNPENIVAWHDLGIIYAGRKEFNRAGEYFLKAAEISSGRGAESESYLSHRVSSLRFLAICREKLGEVGEAVSTYEALLAIQPDDQAAKRSLERLKKATAENDAR